MKAQWVNSGRWTMTTIIVIITVFEEVPLCLPTGPWLNRRERSKEWGSEYLLVFFKLHCVIWSQNHFPGRALFLLSQLEIKNHNDFSDKDSDKRLSVKNALPIAIHCINVNCSSCCCCLQWERLNGTEERKQWFQEEDWRPDRSMAWKRESQEFSSQPSRPWKAKGSIPSEWALGGVVRHPEPKGNRTYPIQQISLTTQMIRLG